MGLLDRLAARVTIDLDGLFATRGGFFEMFGPRPFEPWPHGQPPEPEPTISSSGGLCIGEVRFDGWEPWRPWYCAHPLPSIHDLLPAFTARRDQIPDPAPRLMIIHWSPMLEARERSFLSCCGRRIHDVATPAMVVTDESLATCPGPEPHAVFIERFDRIAPPTDDERRRQHVQFPATPLEFGNLRDPFGGLRR